ncbi:hypothetical protein [Rhizobium mayense]|uniref:Uncharacterized protein n=1 Tax=Rhizobium mayense TaxID=1312184 RepID=A0ABT7K3C4_9HYPH|nr:hypothetical protein [Rhizobium mayense]MDL2403109.1 hypothetical protein [Rhizobium mayense]
MIATIVLEHQLLYNFNAYAGVEIFLATGLWRAADREAGNALRGIAMLTTIDLDDDSLKPRSGGSTSRRSAWRRLEVQRVGLRF